MSEIGKEQAEATEAQQEGQTNKLQKHPNFFGSFSKTPQFFM